jgi:hypothetical protein
MSDGLIVEASILARLLRVKLLRLDATVLVVPAGATASSNAPHAPRERAVGGGRLVDAVRCLDEAAELLARARRDRSLLRRLNAAR